MPPARNAATIQPSYSTNPPFLRRPIALDVLYFEGYSSKSHAQILSICPFERSDSEHLVYIEKILHILQKICTFSNPTSIKASSAGIRQNGKSRPLHERRPMHHRVIRTDRLQNRQSRPPRGRRLPQISDSTFAAMRFLIRLKTPHSHRMPVDSRSRPRRTR